MAQDVTQQGAVAWRKHFSESPAFFMAADGSLQFPDSASATAGIQALARNLSQIDLKRGDDLRLDPLAPTPAVIATVYHQIIVTSSGRRLNSRDSKSKPFRYLWYVAAAGVEMS